MYSRLFRALHSLGRLPDSSFLERSLVVRQNGAKPEAEQYKRYRKQISIRHSPAAQTESTESSHIMTLLPLTQCPHPCDALKALMRRG